jgi:cytidylate kinase
VSDKPKIIGLVGRAYAGKTTVADHLVKTYGFTAVANGDALKTMLITAGLCTHEECYVEKTDRSRELMQKIGTEVFRKQIHPDFWAQRTAKNVHELMAAGQSVVIHDIRFPNEAKLVSAYLGAGLLVKLERVNADGSPYRGAHAEANEHDSERLVDTIDCDCVVMMPTGVPGLIAAVETRLREYGFIP